MTGKSNVDGSTECWTLARETQRRTSVSTIGGGGDTTIPSSRRSPKQPLPGQDYIDPLHDWQVCPEFNSFHQGVCQISPQEGLFRAVPSQTGDNFVTSPPPLIFERLEYREVLGEKTYFLTTTTFPPTKPI